MSSPHVSHANLSAARCCGRLIFPSPPFLCPDLCPICRSELARVFELLPILSEGGRFIWPHPAPLSNITA